MEQTSSPSPSPRVVSTPSPVSLSTSSASLPSRLMVMMFTDLVNSTGIKAEIGAGAYGELVARQDRIVHQCVSETPGAQVLQDTGDRFFITFPTVGDAIASA